MELANKKIILASQSPRRKEILTMIGLEFDIRKSNYHEKPINGKTPQAIAEIHAQKKALDVSYHYDNGLIIGADTIVVIGGDILGKPVNEEHAREMLQKLSGQTHEVLTGVAVVNAENDKQISFVSRTAVSFYDLSETVINRYLADNQYRDKAGSYAIQDYSALFVKKIDGCFYNVVGFPVAEFYRVVCRELQNIL